MALSLGREATASQALLAPTILTNAVGADTIEARARVWSELQAPESSKRTRHLEIVLPRGVAYSAGDHLGICPQNDEERVERLAHHLGTALDSLFRAPETVNVRAVPKGVVLQVRNVLTNLIDITGKPTLPLLQLLLDKVTDPAERSRLEEIQGVLEARDGRGSALYDAVHSGAYDLLRLLTEFPSCRLNIFELLEVAQPLSPRYYSPSSSPRVHGDVVHLTVGLEALPVPGMPERVFHGMSAHYVHGIREGDRVNVFLESASGFLQQMQDFAHISAPQFLRQFEANSFVPVLLRVWVMPGKRCALDHLGAIFVHGVIHRLRRCARISNATAVEDLGRVGGPIRLEL